MDTNSNFKVGIVVTIAIALLLFIVTQMGVLKKENPGTPYYIVFSNVTGLQIGAPVLKAGVKVGKVEYISIISGDKEDKELLDKVRVRVALKNPKETLTDKSIFMISANLMGDKWLEIHPKQGRTLEKVKNGSEPWKDDYAIGITPVTMDDLMIQAQEAITQLQDAVVSLNELVGDKEIQKDMKATVKNMNMLTENLNNLSAKADKGVGHLFGRIDTVMDTADGIMKNVNTVITVAGKDITGFTNTLNNMATKNEEAVSSMVANMNETSHNLNLAMKSLEALVSNERFSYSILDSLENVSKMTSELNGILQDIHSFTSDPQVKEDLKGAIHETRGTMDGANKLIKRVRGFLGEGSSEQSRLIQLDTEMNWDTKGGHSAGNANLYLLPRSEQMLKMGVENIGSDNYVNFQYGRNYGNLRPRVGVVRSKVGAGADVFAGKNVEFSLDAYDPSNVKVDVTGKYVIKNGFYFMGGVRDAFDTKQCVIGVGKRF